MAAFTDPENARAIADEAMARVRSAFTADVDPTEGPPAERIMFHLLRETVAADAVLFTNYEGGSGIYTISVANLAGSTVSIGPFDCTGHAVWPSGTSSVVAVGLRGAPSAEVGARHAPLIARHAVDLLTR